MGTDVGNIARRWRLLQGSNNWEGLLHPLDLDLRKNILIYGGHAEATYDAFNNDRHSKYAGSSRYGKRGFFERVGLTSTWGYDVSRFLYATSKMGAPEAFVIKSLSREAWSSESNWMGYVALTTDAGVSLYGRRDITIAWRGTVQTSEWAEDFNFGQVRVSGLLPEQRRRGAALDKSVEKLVRSGAAKVQQGLYEIYTLADPMSPFNKRSAREQVLQEVKRLVEHYKDDAHDLTITLTGHSLGAALATLCAFDIVINGLNRYKDAESPIPVTVTAFASPRVGNFEFKESVDKLLPELKILRVTNSVDLVPLCPVIGYADVGVQIRIDSRQSPFLNGFGDPICWHNLEAYLHTVAGMQEKGDFKLVVDRDIALVNKWLDWLKEEYLVPPSWWVEKNKGMVQHRSFGHRKLRNASVYSPLSVAVDKAGPVSSGFVCLSNSWNNEDNDEFVKDLRVPDEWMTPSTALQESEWLRIALHKWLDDEYCPEIANEEISKRCSRVYYHCLMEKQADIGDILLQMVRDLETFSFKESFHGAFSSANAAIHLITTRMQVIEDTQKKTIE